jgi:selenide,water dikinase
VLQPLENLFSAHDYPDLLVGIDPPDDAAVWKIDEQRSIVITTDFFTPVVDDPFDFGAIAAANALSDVYAMGATPFLALNIAAFPPQIPDIVLSEIIRGGAEIAKKAGVVIAGGHTVQDNEPKYGLVVLGMAQTNHLLRKSNVKSDDILIMTKPLGIGVTTTAIKRNSAKPEDIIEAIEWMKKLNKTASEIAVKLNLQAATDVTGFSLLGHMTEMALSSKVKIIIDNKKIPFITNAMTYGKIGNFAGGAFDNRKFFSKHIEFSGEIGELMEMMLFDPQTSGGLILACPPHQFEQFKSLAIQQNQTYWEIGYATNGQGIVVN